MGAPQTITNVSILVLLDLIKVEMQIFLTRDHMVKEICELVSRSPSPKVTTVPSLVVAGLVEVEM